MVTNLISSSFSSDAVLSINRAMWDAVLPTLRGVSVRAIHPKIDVRFIYESLGRRERIVTEDIETRVIADFYEDVIVRCVPVEAPIHEQRILLEGERWVFLRYEEASAGPLE